MTTNIIRENGKINIIVSGRLDTMTAPEFDSAVPGADCIDSDVTIDCREMEYISSAGLRSLITLLKNTKSAGHDLEITNLSPAVRPVFDMTGFSSLFKIS